jgi:hypothetical protein
MPANPISELSDAMLREILLLMAQGISPGRLRPEAINVARAILGSPPDAAGLFGNIPAHLRRRTNPDEPSYALKVIGQAEKWLENTSLPEHPVGLSLGCFPAGIESGCRKHLECPAEIERQCPFREDGPDGNKFSEELRERQQDPKQDVMPILRRCQFLGCVRPERAQQWLDEKCNEKGLSVPNDNALDPSQRVVELRRLLGFDGDNKGCSETEAASHSCLDSLCPHFRRSWREPGSRLTDEVTVRDSLNQYRFLQCSLSRPWPIYGFDPERDFDASGLPLEFGSTLSGLDSLPLPHGFTELPLLWLRRAGFSGVGVVVVDEAEKKDGVYYLQMGSSVPFLRDYYEMPYFWFGEKPGSPIPDAVRKQLFEGRPQYIQCLFRGHRQAAADPEDDWRPELLTIFHDSTTKWLAPFGRGRFLYCPDGEVSFFLLFLRILRLLRANEGAGRAPFFEQLFLQFREIATAELWLPKLPNEDNPPDLLHAFNDLLNLSDDGAPMGLRQELLHLGLLADDAFSNPGTVPCDTTPRLRSLTAWLRHFHTVCQDEQQNLFIPADFLDATAPENKRGWLSLRDVVSRLDSAEVPRALLGAAPRCVTAALGDLDRISPIRSTEGFDLRRIVTAILSVVAETLDHGSDHVTSLESMIRGIVKRGRFPLAGYYAWRSSGRRDFCLGHFAVPIGQGNPVETGSVPWREDQFFLAGIDEVFLAGEESDGLFDPHSEVPVKLARGLDNVALLGRSLFGPLADSTINYTIFQRRLIEARQSEETAARSRAHQQTTLLSGFWETLNLGRPLDAMPSRDREDLLQGLRETMRAVINENRIYLDVSTGIIGNKPTEDREPDFASIDIGTFLRDLTSRYRRWARLALATDRMKPIDVEPCPLVAKVPRSYLSSMVWELITNHQKYSTPDARILLTANLGKAGWHGAPTILTISLRSAMAHARRDGNYGIGLKSLIRTIGFMMDLERADLQRPSKYYSFEPDGGDFVSTIGIDLLKVDNRFGATPA